MTNAEQAWAADGLRRYAERLRYFADHEEQSVVFRTAGPYVARCLRKQADLLEAQAVDVPHELCSGEAMSGIHMER